MRSVLHVPFELKAAAEDGARTFEGYGSVFGTIDSYNDTIAKGAFKQTLKDWKKKGKLPKLLLQHGGSWFSAGAEDMVSVGKWTEMVEDDYGLFMKGELFDIETDRLKLTYAALKAGELDGLSIGFRTRKSKTDNDTGIRTLTEIELFEVSLVTFPANDPARVTDVKSDTLPNDRDFERLLRGECGLSAAQAKTVMEKGYLALRREAGPSTGAHELLELIRKGASILTGERAL